MTLFDEITTLAQQPDGYPVGMSVEVYCIPHDKWIPAVVTTSARRRMVQAPNCTANGERMKDYDPTPFSVYAQEVRLEDDTLTIGSDDREAIIVTLNEMRPVQS